MEKGLENFLFNVLLCLFNLTLLRRMRIVIAGAGEVGSHLAKMLSHENHDIVLIDVDEDKLRQIGSMHDLMTMHGSATSFSLLKDANIQKTDLFIAVTESEDTNITAAMFGKKWGRSGPLRESTIRNT